MFPIASISKTFAATAIMRLVEQGKIDLRAPVRTYLPDFRVRDEAVSRDVTVWHLLTHLGGWEGQVSGPDRGTETLKNFVESTTSPTLMQVAPPGAAWSYNNAGFSIAGRVIEAVTGTPINRAIRDLVFQPLGLEHAGTTAGEFIVQRFAAGHFDAQRHGDAAASIRAVIERHGRRRGLCITDLLGLRALSHGRRHRRERRASAEARNARADAHAADAQAEHRRHDRHRLAPAAHGRVRTAAHGGTLGGHILLLEIVPERNFAIAILTNSNVGWRLIQDVEREALKSYLGCTYARNQGIAHRGLVETLPSVEPLAVQPDPAPYVGTFAAAEQYRSSCALTETRCSCRSARTESVSRPPRCRSRSLALTALSSPTAPDSEQSIEFVRDAAGRVNWVRVVGRVAVRTP